MCLLMKKSFEKMFADHPAYAHRFSTPKASSTKREARKQEEREKSSKVFFVSWLCVDSTHKHCGPDRRYTEEGQSGRDELI